MKELNQHNLAMQIGDSEVKVYKNISEEDCLRIVKEKVPSIAKGLEITNSKLSAVKARMSKDPDFLVEYYLLHYAQSQRDKLLNLDLDQTTPMEHRKRVDEYHQYTSLGSVLLYQDMNFGGGSKFFTLTWPNFQWSPYSFNDRASSAKAWGGNVLFEHSWYRGRRLYLIGFPYAEFPDLSQFDFNDIASSILTADVVP